MTYEDRVNIVYNAPEQTVTIYFHGNKIELPGRYSTYEQGMEAGRRYCRERGWQVT